MHILSTEARAAIKAIIVGDINDGAWRPEYLDAYINLSEHPTLSQEEIDAGIEDIFRLQTIDAGLRADVIVNRLLPGGGDIISTNEEIIQAAGDCMAEDLAVPFPQALHRLWASAFGSDYDAMIAEPLPPGPGRRFGRNAYEDYIVTTRIVARLAKNQAAAQARRDAIPCRSYGAVAAPAGTAP